MNENLKISIAERLEDVAQALRNHSADAWELDVKHTMLDFYTDYMMGYFETEYREYKEIRDSLEECFIKIIEKGTK